MPTLLARTFALLNTIKPPVTEQPLPSIYTVTNPDTVYDLQPQSNQRHQTRNDDSDDDSVNHITLRVRKPDVSIWKAAEQGNIAALQYYIQHTTSVDPTILLNTRDPDTDCTLLHLVLSNNHDQRNVVPIIQLLLENGADATARNVYCVQAIHMASLHCPNPLEAIDLLLNYKASPNARDGDGWTPLHYAARFCQPPDPVLELLVKRGADVNLTDAGRKTPLFGLLASGDLVASLDWMIHTAKANVGIRGDFLDPQTRKTRPGTIVLQAAKYGRLDCLSLLIRSPVAMEQLKAAVDREELEHARFLVNENKTRSNDQTVIRCDMLLQLLQELEDALEKDPSALIHQKPVLQEVTVESQEDGSKKVRRRHSSFMSILGSMRKSSNGKSSTLLRKMSRMIRRTKSENNAHPQNNTQ